MDRFREKGWLKLDNAAKLFPAIISDDLTSVFRITAYLKEPVRYSALKEAVEIVSARFPYFNVSLGSGFFWHFLEYSHKSPGIFPDSEQPCNAFAVRRKNELLYRIIVKRNGISVEFLHVLTDGTGALEYIKSLLFTYLKIIGKKIATVEDIIVPDMPIAGEEIEDSYSKFFRKLPAPQKVPKAWQLPFRLNARPRLRVIRTEMSSSELLELSRRHQVSLTVYLVSVYMYALEQIYLSRREQGKKAKRGVLRIEIPVNLRKKYPSRTMRNFTLFVQPELDLRLGTYSFEEIIHSVHHQLQLSSDVKQISRFLSSNVIYEKYWMVRIIPLFIKKMVISAIYRNLASKRLSGMVTNLGVICLPEEMNELIDSFEFIAVPPDLKVKAGIGVASYNDKLHLCFSNITDSPELERQILMYLANQGIHVKILNDH